MKPLQHFDLARRGVSDVVERWQADHDEVRRVWQVEDVLGAINSYFFPRMREAFADFDSLGVLPVSQWSQTTELTRELAAVNDLFKKFATTVKKQCKGYEVAGLATLAENLAWMKSVSAALKKELAALKKIEDKSPSNQELLATVENCRPPASWYESTEMF